MRLLEYVEFNCEYCENEGVSIFTVFVFIFNELYKRRITNDTAKRMMNNLVAIR
jgi:hypothetical protein